MSLAPNGTLQTERLPDGRRQLLRPLRYQIAGFEEPIEVPEGFETDFGSDPVGLHVQDVMATKEDIQKLRVWVWVLTGGGIAGGAGGLITWMVRVFGRRLMSGDRDPQKPQAKVIRPYA